MAVQLPNFSLLSFQDANPTLTGMSASQDMMTKALQNQLYGLQGKKLQAELPYVPLTSVADASSKLAYARLMGPQFLAKLLANPDVRGNIKNPGQLTDLLTNTGVQQSDVLNQYLGAALGGQQPAMPEMMPQATERQSNTPIWDSRKTGNNIPSQNIPRSNPRAYSNDMGLMDGQTTMVDGIPVTIPSEADQYAKNAGEHRGLIKQGEKLGEIRANTLKEWGDEYGSTLRLQDSLDSLSKIATDPVFSTMREKIPFFQDKQLKLLSKIGTPEEQEKIGMFIDDAGRVLQNTYNAWSGKGLKGEFDATKEFKINDNDTINTLVGKLISAQKLSSFNQQRLEFASEFVRNKGMDPQEALQKADKMLNRKKIMSDIDTTLHPKPSDDDINHMAEKYNISREEVMKRLKKKGVM